MKFLDLLRMSSSSLWKRKVRTILTVLGVVVGTASIVVMISLGLGLNRATMAEIEKYGGLTTINVFEKGSIYDESAFEESSGLTESTDTTLHLDDDAVQMMSEIEHVTGVYPVLDVSALAFSGSYQNYILLRGMSPDAFMNQQIELAEGTTYGEGTGSLEVVYGNTVLAGFYNDKTGDGYWYNGQVADIDLMNDTIFYIFDSDSYYDYMWGNSTEEGTVIKPPKKYIVETAGVAAGELDDYSSYGEYVYCDIEQLKTILKKEFKGKPIPDQPLTASGKPYKEIFYSSILVNVDDMNNIQEVQKSIQELGFSANSNSEWIESEQTQLKYIQLVLGGIGAVSLLVAAIGITNTMMMSIYERTKEIGIMKVLGCDLRNIQGMFLLEAGYIGFLGGVAGLVLSYIVSAILNMALSASGMMPGMEVGLSYIPAWLALLAVGFAVLVGVMAGFFPSLRAMKLSPLAAIRNE